MSTTAIKGWIADHGIGIGVAAIVALVIAWWQLNKYVEADLTVTDVSVERDTPDGRLYAITFDVNNSGNQSITIVNAIPLIYNRYPPPKPPKLLLQDGRLEPVKNGQVEGGKMASFMVHAYVERSFIEAGRRDQATFNYPAGTLPTVQMPIQLQVLMYGGDRKHRLATSQELGILYADGKQTHFLRQRSPAQFQEVTGNVVSLISMPEPASASSK